LSPIDSNGDEGRTDDVQRDGAEDIDQRARAQRHGERAGGIELAGPPSRRRSHGIGSPAASAARRPGVRGDGGDHDAQHRKRSSVMGLPLPAARNAETSGRRER
jgi:hypothetical protein